MACRIVTGWLRRASSAWDTCTPAEDRPGSGSVPEVQPRGGGCRTVARPAGSLQKDPLRRRGGVQRSDPTRASVPRGKEMPTVATNKPGTPAPRSGQYQQQGPRGGRSSTEITAVQGKPLPPTTKP